MLVLVPITFSVVVIIIIRYNLISSNNGISSLSSSTEISPNESGKVGDNNGGNFPILLYCEIILSKFHVVVLPLLEV